MKGCSYPHWAPWLCRIWGSRARIEFQALAQLYNPSVFQLLFNLSASTRQHFQVILHCKEEAFLLLQRHKPAKSSRTFGAMWDFFLLFASKKSKGKSLPFWVTFVQIFAQLQYTCERGDGFEPTELIANWFNGFSHWIWVTRVLNNWDTFQCKQ